MIRSVSFTIKTSPVPLVIRVDSVQLDGGDSLFFLNRVVNPYYTNRITDYDYGTTELMWAYPERAAPNQPLILKPGSEGFSRQKTSSFSISAQ